MALVSKTFSQIITFTRASTATYFDATGTLQSAAIDAPRFDYDPATLAAQGLLIEEARTNSIRNNTMQGAVAGTPGTRPTNWGANWTALIDGIQYSVAGIGSENGITYVDITASGTFSGTPGATSFQGSLELSNVITAVVGQTWTQSIYLKLASGSLSGVDVLHRISEINSGGSTVGTINSPTLLSITSGNLATGRSFLTGTTAQATTAFVQPIIRIVYNAAATYNYTLRIGLPQLELGAFATSVIPTTTTALTRSADVASVNTLSPWYNASGGTIFVEGSTQFLPNDSAQFFGVSDGTPNNFFSISANNITSVNRIQGSAFASGANQFTGVNASNGTYTAGATFKAALAFVTNDAQLAFNGATVGSNDVTCTLPTVTSMNLGSGYAAGNRPINGHLRRITYYPRRLSNAELQAITA